LPGAVCQDADFFKAAVTDIERYGARPTLKSKNMENRVILLVEDNPTDEALIRQLLEQIKIVDEIVVARDGTEALGFLFGTDIVAGRKKRVAPQLVLLNLTGPHFDGLDVLRKIRANIRTWQIPVVVFTSSSEEENFLNGYSLAPIVYLRKPVNFEKVSNAIKQLGLDTIAVDRVARVLIVDHHDVVREGLKRILEEQSGAVTFGEASTASEALKRVQEQNWDVALVDPSLENRQGLEVLRDLKRIRPQLPILIVSTRSEEHHARRAFKEGAAGYLTKDSRRTEFVKAVNKVLAGGRYVSPLLAERLVFGLERGTDRPPHEALSDREFEVMQLIASGKTVKEIASLLNLSDRTISTYRARVLEKMEMKTNAELTHYAIRKKLAD
jgi:DNA-binding NarL/FixJ family response regulator